MMADSVQTPADEPVITLVRWFAAPRALVFAAWTDPTQLAEWWGPAGFTNPRVEVDARPGGRWRIDMRAPDGTIYPNSGVYLEFVDQEKIVWTDDVAPDATEWGAQAPPSSVNTALFEEIDGQTRLTITSRLKTIADRDQMIEMGAAVGFGQSLDRLTALLARPAG